MTDRELLEAAAKAAGLKVQIWDGHSGPMCAVDDVRHGRMWMPLIDDGDALRLAVKLKINVSYRENLNGKWAVAERNDIMFCPEPFDPDPERATRRAIVRAAASIGAAIGGKS